MTEVIVKINEPMQLEKLSSFLKNLKVEYRTRVPKPRKKKVEVKEDIFELIKKGALNIPDFENFMKEFEESRQDRPLPFRD
jgi:hypothetical protein